MIEIDGSQLEGGGQILRMSTALSAVTGRAIKVRNIRAKRSPPGLRMQHITAIRSLATLTDGEAEGLELGSMAVKFNPKKIKGGSFYFDIGTAGSTMLILQALAPAATYAPETVSVKIKGGTDNKWAPPVEYTKRVLLPTLNIMGFDGSISLLRRGFYPKGGGIIKSEINPLRRLKALKMLGPADVVAIKGLAYSCMLPAHIVPRIAESTKQFLGEGGHKEVEIELQNLRRDDSLCSVSPGCGIILVAYLKNGGIVAASELGEIGKSSEKIGSNVAADLIGQLKTGTATDRHLADQLIIWMSLAEGRSEIDTSELTLHTLTSIEICRQIVGTKFEVKGELGRPTTLSCVGIGMQGCA